MEMPREVPPSVFATAWSELYKVFSERLEQENVDLMEAVLNAVIDDTQDEIMRFSENEN